MGIFDSIKHAIWGEDEPVNTPEDKVASAETTPASSVSTALNDPAMRDVAAAGVQPVTKPAEIQSAQDAGATSSSVDIATNLDRAAARSGQKLDWRHSIVDLMKALGMDASLAERKELAAELDYRGDDHDSARMNIFLHKALMKKLSENGGKVPAELLN